MPERKLHVFLCHASQDKPVVRELYQRLLAEGWIDPWLDVRNLLPGQDWRVVIEEAVESADNVIICLSNNSVSKEGYVQREMKYAQEISLEKPEGTIFLIPLRLDECEAPRGLRLIHWTNYFGIQKEQSYEDLLKSLQTRLEEKIRKEAEEKERLEVLERSRLAAEEDARKKAEEKAQKKAEQKARREARLRAQEEAQRVKTLLEEKQRLESELSKSEAILNDELEEKKRLQASLEEKTELSRKQLEERTRVERELQEKINIQEEARQGAEEARKNVEKKLEEEKQKKDNLSKRVAFENTLRKILTNGIVVGIVTLALLPLGFVSDLLILILLPIVSAIVTAYRLVKTLSQLSNTQIVWACSAGGLVSSFPFICSTGVMLSNSFGGAVWAFPLLISMVGGGLLGYYLSRKNRVAVIETLIGKIVKKLSSAATYVFILLLKLAAPFIASYAFYLLSGVLVLKQRYGFPTDLTNLVSSYGTQMAMLNAVFVSAIYVVAGLFVLLKTWLSKKKLPSANKSNTHDSSRGGNDSGCSFYLLFVLFKVIVLVGIFYYTKQVSSPIFYYWIGSIFHPLFLVAIDFVDSGLFTFLVVVFLELIPLSFMDAVYLGIGASYFAGFAKNEVVESATSED